MCNIHSKFKLFSDYNKDSLIFKVDCTVFSINYFYRVTRILVYVSEIHVVRYTRRLTLHYGVISGSVLQFYYSKLK